MVLSLSLVGKVEAEEEVVVEEAVVEEVEVEVVTSPLLPTPLIVSLSSTITATAEARPVMGEDGEGKVARRGLWEGARAVEAHAACECGAGQRGTVLLHSGLLGHHDGCASGQQQRSSTRQRRQAQRAARTGEQEEAHAHGEREGDDGQSPRWSSCNQGSLDGDMHADAHALATGIRRALSTSLCTCSPCSRSRRRARSRSRRRRRYDAHDRWPDAGPDGAADQGRAGDLDLQGHVRLLVHARAHVVHPLPAP